MKRSYRLLCVGLLVASLWTEQAWSQAPARRPIANDSPRGGTTRTPTRRPGTAATTAQQRTAATTQPTTVRPTQETCNCVTFASIEHPIMPPGTLARHVALGGGGYGMGGDLRTYVANPYLIDGFSYTINPAYADRFREVIFTNIGSVSTPIGTGSTGTPGVAQPLSNFGGQSFGAIFSISPRVTIGGIVALESNPGFTAVNTDIASALAATALLTFPGWTGRTIPDNPSLGVIPLRARNTFYLSTSYNTGGVVLAAGVSYVSSVLSPIATNATVQSPQTAVNLTQIGFNAGVLITTATNSMLDISATLLLPRLSRPVASANGNTVSVSPNASEAFSATVLGLNARYIARLSRYFWLIPMVNFYSVSAPATVTGNITSIDGGLGMNYHVGNLLFIGGIGVSATNGGNLGPTPVSSELIFPRFNLGAEYAATNWLRLRAGYSHATSNRSFGSTVLTQDARQTVYNPYGLLNGGVTLGFGLNFGGFTLDVTTDTESIRRGFGGIGTTPSFGYVSAVMRF